MIVSTLCKGTSMYYVITKGRGGQKAPNLGYVIHGWFLKIKFWNQRHNL